MPITARHESAFLNLLFKSTLLVLFLLIFNFLPQSAYAQQSLPPQNIVPQEIQQSNNAPQTNEINTPDYLQPNLNPDVPRNMHTFAQAALIESVSVAYCVLTGVDPVNPEIGCLDIDPTTGKIGMSPPSNHDGQLGGLISITPVMFSYMYTPPASSKEYFNYLASNFGIVQPAHAAPANGFEALSPIADIWIGVRNIAYLFFVVIFLIIGLGIMLRLKIDPRTVMTIQNQIPRIIVSILLVTFSYAIVGLMIDLMWTATFAGINLITSNLRSAATAGTQGAQPLDNCNLEDTEALASRNILSNPVGYANSVLHCGIDEVATNISDTLSITLAELINNAVGDPTPYDQLECGLLNPFNCLLKGVKWILSLILYLIILCIIIFLLVRVWFELLKAYIMIILYTISSPLWIIMGLLPGKPLGFEKWIRRVFANMAIFPATAILIILASYLMTAFNNTSSANGVFVPPLVGNPNLGNFGSILAFGILLTAPGLLNILRQSLHAAGAQGSAASLTISNAMATGAAPAKGLGQKAWQQAFGKNPYTQKVGFGRYILGGYNNPNSRRYRWITKNLERFGMRNPNSPPPGQQG